MTVFISESEANILKLNIENTPKLDIIECKVIETLVSRGRSPAGEFRSPPSSLTISSISLHSSITSITSHLSCLMGDVQFFGYPPGCWSVLAALFAQTALAGEPHRSCLFSRSSAEDVPDRIKSRQRSQCPEQGQLRELVSGVDALVTVVSGESRNAMGSNHAPSVFNGARNQNAISQISQHAFSNQAPLGSRCSLASIRPPRLRDFQPWIAC